MECHPTHPCTIEFNQLSYFVPEGSIFHDKGFKVIHHYFRLSNNKIKSDYFEISFRLIPSWRTDGCYGPVGSRKINAVEYSGWIQRTRHARNCEHKRQSSRAFQIQKAKLLHHARRSAAAAFDRDGSNDCICQAKASAGTVQCSSFSSLFCGSSPTWRSKSRCASSSLFLLKHLFQALATQRQSADAHSLLLPTTQARGLPSCFRLQQAAIFLLLLVKNPLHRILRIPNNLSNDLLHVQIDRQLIFYFFSMLCLSSITAQLDWTIINEN